MTTINDMVERCADTISDTYLLVWKKTLKERSEIEKFVSAFEKRLIQNSLNSQYLRHGKKYVKLRRDEVIKEGAMQSWHDGELIPIASSDETVGQTPSRFSEERDFYNPL